MEFRSPAGSRYLLPFEAEHLPVLRWPVLVVGGGAAGAGAALEAAAAGAEVLLIQKDVDEASNTYRAQGGIAAAVDREDNFENHAGDTLEVGRGLADVSVVEAIVEQGPEVVSWLENIGVRFDSHGGSHQGSHGATHGRGLSLEGGHSFPRVLSSEGDATGKAIQMALTAALDRHPRIHRRRDLMVVDLLTARGRCIGVLALNGSGQLLIVLGGTTVLATGASGQLYRETTNPSIATGDGVGMSWRAGACIQDLEFVQFHPTTLYIAGAARVLISEAVRGAGARLIDRHGERVMQGVHPDLDLAPRDVVSRAILDRMVATGDTNVFLDASGISAKERFPGIARMCAAFGIDIDKDPIPVRPGAHYQVGGVKTDLHAGTGIEGLLACGEVASTGLHGANRLASNSLLEALVMGRIAGTEAAAADRLPGYQDLEDLDSVETGGPSLDPGSRADLNLDDMLYSLKSLMWRQAGLIREAHSLEDAIEKIVFWAKVLHSRPMPERRWVELSNMLCVSRLLCSSALRREESRGTHFRSDYPDRDDEHWQRHTCTRREDPDR